MKKLALGLALVLWAGPAQAGPIGTTWLPMSASNDGTTWFNHTSADSQFDNVTYKLTDLYGGGWEYLAGGFGYTDWAGGDIVYQQTDWKTGGFNYDGLSFSYDSGTGRYFNSWQGTNIFLFRQQTSAGLREALCAEDHAIDESGWDGDCNDQIRSWFTPSITDQPPPEVPPVSTPEPSTAYLGLAGIWFYRKWICRNTLT